MAIRVKLWPKCKLQWLGVENSENEVLGPASKDMFCGLNRQPQTKLIVSNTAFSSGNETQAELRQCGEHALRKSTKSGSFPKQYLAQQCTPNYTYLSLGPVEFTTRQDTGFCLETVAQEKLQTWNHPFIPYQKVSLDLKQLTHVERPHETSLPSLYAIPGHSSCKSPTTACFTRASMQ